jgi:hypothetical protein
MFLDASTLLPLISDDHLSCFSGRCTAAYASLPEELYTKIEARVTNAAQFTQDLRDEREMRQQIDVFIRRLEPDISGNEPSPQPYTLAVVILSLRCRCSLGRAR